MSASPARAPLDPAPGPAPGRAPLHVVGAPGPRPDALPQLAAAAMPWLSSVIDVAQVSFWLVDERLRPVSVIVEGGADAPRDAAAHLARYVAEFEALDPFSARRFADRRVTVACTRDLERPESFLGSAFAEGFLTPSGHGHQAVLFLRRHGRIAGRIVLQRRLGEPDFSRDSLLLLHRCHPLLQHAFSAILDAAGPAWSEPAHDLLTRREREVAALVAAGASNAEIAAALSISLATVKTHVRRILAKCGVRSRLQLTLRLQREAAA